MLCCIVVSPLHSILWQMVSFVLQALDIAQMRNPLAASQRLDPEDCLFLMRKNQVKLRRLYRFEIDDWSSFDI